MSTRVSDNDIREMVATTNRLLDVQPKDRKAITVEWAYGNGARLYDRGGSREISPRLRNGQMADYIHGIWTGIEAANAAR